MLRSLAYSIACALTGAASGLLVVHLATPPAPTCPRAPVVELRQVATALAHAQYVAPRPPPPPAVEPAPFVLVDGVTCPTDRHCVIRRELFIDLLDRPSRLARLARVVPSFTDGEPRGLKFYGMRPGSLPRALGMKNGDLLTAIDGVRARTLDDLLAQLGRLRTARSFTLDVERRGEPVALRIDVE